VGRTWKESVWSDNVNPSQTVIGDTGGTCRGQAGYSGDQVELVVTDATGDWTGGHVLRGTGQDDDRTRLVGFTHALDGTVSAYIDGVSTGAPQEAAYDAGFMSWNAVGCGYSTGSRAQVLLGVVVVVPGVVSAEDIARLTIFAEKWGVGTGG
jgi:hypothetical protein